MGDRAGQGGEGHNEHAGAHGSLKLVAQHAGQDEQHHHTAAGTNEAADHPDDHTADDRLEGTLLSRDPLHGFFGGHNGLDDEFNAQQERHKHREAAHGGGRHQACHPAAHHGEQQHAGHHNQAVLDIKVLVFVVGVGRHRTGQHIRGKGNADCHVGVHPQEGDEHRADDRGSAHARKAGAQARAHSGKKGNNDGKQQVHLILLLPGSHPGFRSSYR